MITLSINIYDMKTCEWIPLPLNAVHMAILLKEMELPVLILIKTKLFSEEISYRMIFPEDRRMTDSVAEEINEVFDESIIADEIKKGNA